MTRRYRVTRAGLRDLRRFLKTERPTVHGIGFEDRGMVLAVHYYIPCLRGSTL